MHKHSAFFANSEECINAADWILEEYSELTEDWDLSNDKSGLFVFYTALALTERQQQIITSNVAPVSFLSEEL